MKLQRQLARTYQGKDYDKWVVIIPPRHIQQLGWKEGEELESKIRKEALVIEKWSEEGKPQKLTYEVFRDKIKELLSSDHAELSWTEIKEKLAFPQTVPNNLWVRQLERDIGLIREKIGTKTQWRLK